MPTSLSYVRGGAWRGVGGNARATEEANRQGAIPIATINGTRLAEIARDRGAAELLG